MSSQMVLAILASSLAIIGIVAAVALIWLCRDSPDVNDPEKWYSRKFKRLVAMFVTGFTFFSILVSFLAMIPRYDYEVVRSELEKMREESRKNDDMLNRRALRLDTQIAEVTQRRDAQIAEVTQRLDSQIANATQRLNNLEKAIQKDYAETIRPAVAKTLKVSLPEVKTPDINFPKIDVPKIDVPQIDVPKIDVPQIDVPKIDVPSVNIPKVEKK